MSELQAGWYPDQSDASLERYWDGAKWTSETRSAPAAESVAAPVAAAPRKINHRQGLMILGIVTLVAVAFVITLVLMNIIPTPTKYVNTSADLQAVTRLDFLTLAKPDFPDVPNDRLVELGHLVCDTYKAQTPNEQVIGLMLGKGLSKTQVISLVYASVSKFCPEYTKAASQS
jgi:Protein of unknown function (DUF2510)/Protein of unknown function (DUF732)